MAFPTLRKSSQKIFWHFPHSGNRLKNFFGVSHTQETVSKNFFAISRTQESLSKIFLAFPTLRKPSQNFFGISRFKIIFLENAEDESEMNYYDNLINRPWSGLLNSFYSSILVTELTFSISFSVFISKCSWSVLATTTLISPLKNPSPPSIVIERILIRS